VEIWALVVSPSNRSLHKCHRAEHEPVTARLKTALPQSWFQISSGDLHTTTDACKRARETRAAARVTQNFRGCLAQSCLSYLLDILAGDGLQATSKAKIEAKRDRERKASFCSGAEQQESGRRVGPKIVCEFT